MSHAEQGARKIISAKKSELEAALISFMRPNEDGTIAKNDTMAVGTHTKQCKQVHAVDLQQWKIDSVNNPITIYQREKKYVYIYGFFVICMRIGQ